MKDILVYSLVGLAAAIISAIIFFVLWRNERSEIKSLKSENNLLKGKLEEATQRADEKDDVIALLNGKIESERKQFLDLIEGLKIKHKKEMLAAQSEITRLTNDNSILNGAVKKSVEYAHKFDTFDKSAEIPSKKGLNAKIYKKTK